MKGRALSYSASCKRKPSKKLIFAQLIRIIMDDQKSQISANPFFGKELVADVISIVREGRESAYAAVNANAIETYWRVGKRIVEEEQKGRLRAEYGTQLL